jgi:hypothetical protein
MIMVHYQPCSVWLLENIVVSEIKFFQFLTAKKTKNLQIMNNEADYEKFLYYGNLPNFIFCAGFG